MIGTFILALALQQSAEGNPMCNQAEADKGVQTQMNICAAEEFSKSDAALNAQWKITSAAMKQRDQNTNSTDDNRPGYLAALFEAQRAWLKFRDAHCRSQAYSARGGSMEPMLYSACQTSLTIDRINQLHDLQGDGL